LLSSGIAAGNAESAAIQAALPIASQDASTYGTTAAQNMAAQNTASIAGAQNVTQGNLAGMNARTNLTGQQMQIGASREQNAIARNQTSAENYLNRQQQTQSQTSQQNFLADQAQRNNDFAATQNQLNRNFDSSEATRNFYRQTTAAALSTVFGSPEYMRDPAGASGLINFFTTQIESLYPDFGAPSGANGAPGTPPVPPATNAPPPVAPPPAVMQPNPGG
jgi:hypothetical protein